MSSRAVFLDKDGTLVEDIPYNVDPDRIRLTEGAYEALRLIQEHDFKLIVISNQSGVARGFFQERDLFQVRSMLKQLLAAAGVFLTDFYYCPHLPEGSVREYAVDCTCRKPQPGMLYRAAQEHDLDLSASWLVGDILHDIEAGNRAGCRTVLLDNGHETEWQLSPGRQPDFIVKNLKGAADKITADSLERNLNYGK
ncbi:MAG TPA: HAD family hydrolase [Anaerolineales bacterium]|nr:HAD family hydrolase [Anaerolineales bacterium]